MNVPLQVDHEEIVTNCKCDLNVVLATASTCNVCQGLYPITLQARIDTLKLQGRILRVRTPPPPPPPTHTHPFGGLQNFIKWGKKRCTCVCKSTTF